MCRVALVLLTFLVAAGTHAGALEDVMSRQKNGMWEMKPPGYQGKPLLFCVTDEMKIGGLQETRAAVASLGCKPEKDSLSGDRYQIVLQCSNANPNVGNFRMVMQGTARTDYQSGTTTLSGGGPLVRQLFPDGQEGGGESRWIRSCRTGEKPGLQGG